MNTSRRFLATIALSCLLSAWSSRAKADFDHASTAERVLDTALDNTGLFASSLSASGVISGNGVSLVGSGSAAVGPDGGYVVLHSLAQMVSEHSRDGVRNGTVYSAATWRDILYLGSTDPALVGQTLRINFYTQGQILYSGGPLVAGGSDAGITASGYTDYGTYSSAATVQQQFNDARALQANGYDTISLGPNGTFQATAHLDIPILSGLGYRGVPGSVLFSFTDASQVDGEYFTGPDASLFAADPLGIQSITLPDVGNVTPESLGVQLTFDSGLLSPNLRSVPEPGSFALLGTGVAALFFHAQRRQRASRVESSRR
jgi:hypothetical protein